MKSFLVDVNVWLALASDRHVHYAAAHVWFDTVGREQACFCRFTQLALLRLLTNASVMGPDVLAPATAWLVYDRLRADERVRFVPEPPEVEPMLRNITQKARGGPGLWTDAYLGALACARQFTLVSFDRAFRTIPGIQAVILPPLN